ncbi:MAG: hypothetical protein IJB64_04705 [Akkermansia sp.]|nr:hypothetical protein [Akkermansia sp.]
MNINMKNTIFLSSLLAVCVATVAQADEIHEEIFFRSGTKKVDGNLTVNRLQLGELVGDVANLIVSGKTTINSNLSKGNACQVQATSTLESDEIEFICATTNFTKTFSILGTVKTNKFIVSGTEEFPGTFTITQGKLVSLSEGTPGILQIGANVTAHAGGVFRPTYCTIGLHTEVNGGTFNVNKGATMADITLNSGNVNILSETESVGLITVNNGSLSLEEAAIISDVTMNDGTLNILGDVQTGALTLNGGTINFSADSAIDLGEESLILGDKVMITLNVDTLDNTEGVVLFKNMGNVDGLDELTVKFVDANGATKEAAVAYSNGSVVTAAIPEPTTATLSLLALAGLAVRRRRASR